MQPSRFCSNRKVVTHSPLPKPLGWVRSGNVIRLSSAFHGDERGAVQILALFVRETSPVHHPPIEKYLVEALL